MDCQRTAVPLDLPHFYDAGPRLPPVLASTMDHKLRSTLSRIEEPFYGLDPKGLAVGDDVNDIGNQLSVFVRFMDIRVDHVEPQTENNIGTPMCKLLK